MRATITDNKWIHFSNITVAEEEILWNEFSVAKPQKPGVFIDPAQMVNWDGIYRKYNKGQQRIARPFLSKLRSICTKHDLPLVIMDDRPEWKYQQLRERDPRCPP